jgi:transposase
MPKAFPKEFREDVIRVCRDSDASMAQVAKDFGISPPCLKRRLAIDERTPGLFTPGCTGPATSRARPAAPPRWEHSGNGAKPSVFDPMGVLAVLPRGCGGGSRP